MRNVWEELKGDRVGDHNYLSSSVVQLKYRKSEQVTKKWELQGDKEGEESSHSQNSDPGEHFTDYSRDNDCDDGLSLLAVHQCVRTLQRQHYPCTGPVKVWPQSMLISAKTGLKNYGEKGMTAQYQREASSIPTAWQKLKNSCQYLKNSMLKNIFLIGNISYFEKHIWTSNWISMPPAQTPSQVKK